MSPSLALTAALTLPAAGWLGLFWLVYRRPRAGTGLSIALTVTLVLAGIGGAGLVVFRAAGLDLEHDSALLYAGIALAALLAGSAAARRARRVPGLDLLLGALPVLHAGAVLAYLQAGESGVASASLRVYFIAVPTLGLLSYFGASVAHLMRAGGLEHLVVGYEVAVGRRFLLSKASPVLSTVTAISVVGVSLGVWLVIVVLAILGGFENDLMRKIIGAHAHLVVQERRATPFADDAELARLLDDAPGVVGIAPFVQGEVAVASGANHTGSGMLIGIDVLRSPAVLSVLTQIDRGSLDGLVAAAEPEAQDAPAGDEFAAPARAPGVVIGVEMARQLAVSIGDKIRVLSPMLEVLTPVGPAPKSVGFEVVGVFDSKMYEYDAHLAFVTLDAARTFFELNAEQVSGYHLRVDDPERSDLVARSVVTAAGPERFEALDWKSRNQSLFAALKLERVVAFIVLAFIILVASFSIVNTLTMSVIEKRKEIAILKTMGAHDVGIMKVFLTQGLLVGGVGTLIGAGMAVGTVWALGRFKLWIPEDVYYIDALPVHLEPADVVLVGFAALLIVWNFAVFPALHGSRLLPVDGLRDG